jgi:hypothetical protein
MADAAPDRSSDGDDEAPANVPYLKYAFQNVYNYTLLSGVASASLFTQNLWLAVLGVGAEVLWLTFSPDSTVLRKLWFDPRHRVKLAAEAEQAQRLRIANLDSSLTGRVNNLQIIQRQIHRLAEENPALTKELLRDELSKLDGVWNSFVDLALLTQRYRVYLEGQKPGVLAEDRRRYEEQCRSEKDPDQRKVAQKNLDVILKRQDKLREIRSFIDKASGQMDLIENTFGLLADQIVSMRSPKELSGQLDDLSDGVEAVKTTARETDALLEAAG